MCCEVVDSTYICIAGSRTREGTNVLQHWQKMRPLAQRVLWGCGKQWDPARASLTTYAPSFYPHLLYIHIYTHPLTPHHHPLATLARHVPFLWQSLPPSLPVQCLGQWSSMPRLTSCARTEQIQLHFCCIRTSWLSCWKPLVSIASSVRTNWITRSMSCCGSKLTQMPVNLLNMKMFSRPPPRPNLVTHVLHSGFRRVKPWSLSPKRIAYLTKVIRDDWNSLEWIRPSGYMEWLLFYWSGNGVRLRRFIFFKRSQAPAGFDGTQRTSSRNGEVWATASFQLHNQNTLEHLQCGSNVVVIVHCDHRWIVTWRIHQFSSSCNPPSVVRGYGRCLGLTQESQRTIHGPLKPKPWHALSTWVVGDQTGSSSFRWVLYSCRCDWHLPSRSSLSNYLIRLRQNFSGLLFHICSSRSSGTN